MHCSTRILHNIIMRRDQLGTYNWVVKPTGMPDSLHTGIGLEKPSTWTFDTTQFDSAPRKPKVMICKQATNVKDDEDVEKDDNQDKWSKDGHKMAIKATWHQGARMKFLRILTWK